MHGQSVADHPYFTSQMLDRITPQTWETKPKERLNLTLVLDKKKFYEVCRIDADNSQIFCISSVQM